MELKEKKISAIYPYQGRVIRLEEATVLCPNGKIDTREVVRRTSAAAILARKQDGTFIMERQYRYPYDEILLEIPAGKQDEKEEPLAIATRELEEETGYYAHHMVYLGKIYPTCGYSDEVIHLFYADELEKKEKHWDENEFLELETYTFEELLALVQQGKIVDAKTICAIQLYDLWRKQND